MRGNATGWAFSANDIAQAVVHADLVVEPVETGIDVTAIERRIIDFADENEVRISVFDLRNRPFPKSDGHHENHVATEAVDALRCPEKQDVEHLLPRVGNRVEMLGTTACVAIINAVVQLDGFVPVVTVRTIGKLVVSSGFRRVFVVVFKFQGLIPEIIIIIVDGKMHRRVVVLAQIALIFGLTNRLILPCNMIRNEVDNHLHLLCVGTTDKRLKLIHPTLNIDRQIGIDIVVIGDGVGRPCPTLHHLRMLTRNVKSRVIGLRGVANDARQPDVRNAEAADAPKRAVIEVVELSTTVFLDAPIRLPRRVFVSKQTRK